MEVVFLIFNMKKVIATLILGSALALTACSDFFVDPVTVHNGLVDRMDEVLDAEQSFYDEYFGVEDGQPLADLRKYNDAFAAAAADLEEYFADTKFADSQQVFVDGYNDDYKAVLADYVADAEVFVAALEANGETFDFETAEGYFPKMDEHATAFVASHNALIDTINLQADY